MERARVTVPGADDVNDATDRAPSRAGNAASPRGDTQSDPSPVGDGCRPTETLVPFVFPESLRRIRRFDVFAARPRLARRLPLLGAVKTRQQVVGSLARDVALEEDGTRGGAGAMRRRAFLGGLSLTGAAGLLGLVPGPSDAEPAPETTRLRLTFQGRTICAGLRYFRERLEAEGFTDLQYPREESLPRRLARLASGESDIDITYAANLIVRIDAADPIVVLAGAHLGCFLRVFGHPSRRSRHPKRRGGVLPWF